MLWKKTWQCRDCRWGGATLFSILTVHFLFVPVKVTLMIFHCPSGMLCYDSCIGLITVQHISTACDSLRYPIFPISSTWCASCSPLPWNFLRMLPFSNGVCEFSAFPYVLVHCRWCVDLKICLFLFSLYNYFA